MRQYTIEYITPQLSLKLRSHFACWQKVRDKLTNQRGVTRHLRCLAVRRGAAIYMNESVDAT